METWVVACCVIVAIALVVQVAILTMLFLQTKRTMEQVTRITNDLNGRIGPILTRVQIMLDDTQPKITQLVGDAAHVVYLARGQAQKADRVFTDAADRLRGQLAHLDRILTGLLETVEDAGVRLQDSFFKPMHKASALVQGIKVGIDILRSRRAASSSSSRRRESDDVLETEEELFI